MRTARSVLGSIGGQWLASPALVLIVLLALLA